MRFLYLALLGVFLGIGGDERPALRVHAEGDSPISWRRPPQLDYELYFPSDHQAGRSYPMLVGVFDSPEDHAQFLRRWREYYGDQHPFYYVVPRSGGSEVGLPTYSLSSPANGGIPIQQIGRGELERSLSDLVRRLSLRHSIAGAFLVTSQGMKRLDAPMLISQGLEIRRF